MPKSVIFQSTDAPLDEPQAPILSNLQEIGRVLAPDAYRLTRKQSRHAVDRPEFTSGTVPEPRTPEHRFPRRPSPSVSHRTAAALDEG